MNYKNWISEEEENYSKFTKKYSKKRHHSKSHKSYSRKGKNKFSIDNVDW